MEERIGLVLRLGVDGLGVILEEGENGEVRPFTFDKLFGYRKR